MNGVKFPNGTYKHRKVVGEMSATIASAIEDNIKKEVQESTFYGVIADESCDVSNFKKLIVYFVYPDKCGITNTSFADIIDLVDGTAETVTQAILKVIRDYDLKLECLVGLGTDGAAVMMGRKNGVGVKIREAGANLLTQIHCAAHRVSLAVSQAANKITVVKEAELTLSQLFRFFKNSPVRESVLRQIIEINDCPDIKLKELKQIRWLSLYDAVEAVVKLYPCIVEALEYIAERRIDVNSASAKGLLQKIKEFNFVYCICITLDILEPLRKLSCIFQAENVMFSKINPMVSSTISILETLQDCKEKSETQFEEDCETNERGATQYKGIELKSKVMSRSVKSQLISAVVKNLKKRFPIESLSTIKALDSILNPKSYPRNQKEIPLYGMEDVKHLSIQYTSVINSDVLMNDFLHFKQLTYSYASLNMVQYVEKLVSEYSEEFPEFVKLAKIASAVPVSSAAAERGFSCMKRIKTAERNRLEEAKLKNLMMVKLQGPELEKSNTIIEEANDRFLTSKKRVGGQIP